MVPHFQSWLWRGCWQHHSSQGCSQGDSGNISSFKFLTLTCQVSPENHKMVGKKNKWFLVSLICPLFPHSQLSTGKMGLEIGVLYIYDFNPLDLWLLGLSFTRSRLWGKAMSYSGLFGRRSQETWSREWGSDIGKGEVSMLSLLSWPDGWWSTLWKLAFQPRGHQPFCPFSPWKVVLSLLYSDQGWPVTCFYQ